MFVTAAVAAEPSATPLATELVFAIWLAVGLLALVIGAIVVRISTRRLRRSELTVAENETGFSVPSPHTGSIRAAA